MEEEPRKVRAMQRGQRVQKISGLEMNGVQDFGVSRLRSVRVLFLPMLPDIQNSAILLEGSYASPACRSDTSSINVR
jgi:hypothetical protein